MTALIQPVTLLLIIVAGYLFKRFGLFGDRDYRVIQKAVFNLILPGAIVYSFATNPHDISLLLVSGFAFVAALVPTLVMFAYSRRRPVADRAFLMLNGSGYNVGCFCFPVLQSLIGPAALVPAAMFDVGNCVMVSAGTNVMTQTLLHIRPGRTLAEQHAGDAPTLPYERPKDRDARRLAHRALAGNVARGFLTSPSFDTYLLMIALMLAGVDLPGWLGTFCQPFSAANAFCSMLMVGMLMDLPATRHDVRDVLEIVGWRIPFAALFAAAAWFLLPFDAATREAVALCCLAPTAIFATLYTDRVLGNARLAGFALSLTAVIALVTMTGASMLMG
ncbi:AEC family transporter [Bifidobacterium phasiani]|uniref:AEC family transporter n=1 Tax=Bifidobacterium phasiani TaxID=2834431 RepID=A0ABS6W8G4_9BIFI|nr:AEC family transporter [Bifidobacterium phasiani]MBW3082770.1 AEC family transporter [Bifidobacterium phasiani]